MLSLQMEGVSSLFNQVFKGALNLKQATQAQSEQKIFSSSLHCHISSAELSEFELTSHTCLSKKSLSFSSDLHCMLTILWFVFRIFFDAIIHSSTHMLCFKVVFYLLEILYNCIIYIPRVSVNVQRHICVAYDMQEYPKRITNQLKKIIQFSLFNAFISNELKISEHLFVVEINAPPGRQVMSAAER